MTQYEIDHITKLMKKLQDELEADKDEINELARQEVKKIKAKNAQSY